MPLMTPVVEVVVVFVDMIKGSNSQMCPLSLYRIAHVVLSF